MELLGLVLDWHYDLELDIEVVDYVLQYLAFFAQPEQGLVKVQNQVKLVASLVDPENFLFSLSWDFKFINVEHPVVKVVLLDFL